MAPVQDEPAVADEEAKEAPRRCPVVAIGASAGGLEALETLFRRIAIDGMAFVVLQHLAPSHESMLSEILARCTPMTVVRVRDGIPIEQNHIYVVPANMDISLDEGVIRGAVSERLPRHSLDALFRSMARDLGPSAIGVVLSGSGSDGTLGLKAIKSEGGITFVQDPATAGHGSMRQSAIDARVGDFTMSPAEIGDERMRRSAHPFRARRRPVQIFAEDVLRQLLDRLRAAFGVDFGGYKRSTIERRIERRMALQKIDRVEEYLKFLEVSGSELSLLYGDLLIGVTGFFRDREPFETLKEVVFPRLLERRSTDMPIRIWVTGCATGEEAYSVAMSLLEYLGDRAASYRIQIFATDIDDQALNRARQGVYPPNIELDVSPDRLQRFFSRHEKGYQVARPIRDMVVFARHNLGKDPPFSRVDLVTCRNVLIYMQPALQRRVLRIFHYALNPDAFLLLGTSESVGDASELFSLLDRRIKVYLKKNTPSAAVFDFALGARAGAEDHRSGAPIVDHRPEVSMQQLADRKVIEKYGPPAVLLNEQLEIIQFRGHTGPFLAPAPGTATFNIFKLARPELLMELRATLQRASVELVAVSSSPIPGWDGRNTPIVIDVMPLQDAGANRRCLLVSFRELAVPPAAAEAPAAIRIQERHPGLAELERDLVTTKEYLQTTVQELEVANEGLQSSNEELQSSNEELQSTNEELETSKEELQSTNEELATVNEELQNRMAQLALANDDLQNMLACVSSSMVIVGMDLRIRRFTSTAEKLLSLIATDVGRPVAYLGAVIKAPQIEQIVAETINTVSTREQRVRAVDGHWYMMRISPYRTADHAIRGVVIELNRATAALRKGVPPDDVNELVAKSFTKLPFAVMFLDAGLRIVWVNKRLYDMFGLTVEVLDASLDEVWAGRSENPELWSLLEATVAGGASFEDVAVERAFGRPSGRPLRFSGHFIPEDGERAALMLVTITE